MARDHIVKVTLDAGELARLDELRHSGTSRPAFLRSLSASRPETTRSRPGPRLWQSSPPRPRDGKVASAIALERALRHEAAPDNELDRILGET